MIEIFTALLVIITGFYAWVTYKILKANEGVIKEMQLQQDAISRPYISISPGVYPDNPCFFLKISNTGKTAAEKLRLKIDHDFYKFGQSTPENNIKNLKAFNSQIDCFVPGAEMLFYLAQSFVIFGEDSNEKITPESFSIVAEYEYANRKVSEQTLVDLRPYFDSAMPQDPIVQKLKQLNKIIEKKNF